MMRPAWDSFWFWLADYYVLATFILLAAVVVLAALRQPARRLTVSWSVLGGLVTLLVLGAVPSWPRTGLPSPLSPVQPRHVPTETVSAEPPFPREEEPNSAMPRSEALTTSGKPQRDRLAKPAPPMRSPEMVPQARPIRSWPWLVCRAFLAGGGLMVGWLVLGSWQTARLRRQARAAPAWSTALLAQVVGPDHRVPKLLVCTALRQPVAAGILRPAILLPERFSEDAPENRLEAVLTHEWAHIRNRDLWLLALLRLLLPILYAHPAYWWLRRRIRDDQEALADASAAALEGRENYAEVLLSWSKQASDGPRFAAGGAWPCSSDRPRSSGGLSCSWIEAYGSNPPARRGGAWPFAAAWHSAYSGFHWSLSARRPARPMRPGSPTLRRRSPRRPNRTTGQVRPPGSSASTASRLPEPRSTTRRRSHAGPGRRPLPRRNDARRRLVHDPQSRQAG